MYQQNKKKIVLLLVVIAFLLLLFGLYFLFNLFFSGTFGGSSDMNLPKKSTSLSVNSKSKPEIFEAKTVLKVESSTSSDQLLERGQKMQDLINMVTDFVERIGSGSNKDGFMGYMDVVMNVDSSYKINFLNQLQELLKKYSSNFGFFEMRTKVLVKDVLEGAIGDDLIKIKLQGQYMEDEGDISKLTLVQYKQYIVIMKKQKDGKYLVSDIQEKVLNK